MPQKLLKPSTNNIPEQTYVSIRTLKDVSAISTTGPSLLINCNSLDYIRVNLTQDCIIGLTGATKDGQQLVLAIYQSGPVPFRIAFMPNTVRLGSDIFSIPELSNEIYKLDRFIFMYDQTQNIYDLVGYARGY